MSTEWQQQFRAYFPITQHVHYANIAYTSPLAPAVSHAIGAFFDRISNGLSDKPEWLQDAEHCRIGLAKLINGKARRIAFTKNTCEALNLVAQGLSWRPGDNLVINDQEHPSNLLPWLNLRRRGVDVRIARASRRTLSIESILAKIDAHTRVVVVSWVQSTSGQRIDLVELAAQCRKRGTLLVVDAIQALGLLQLDLAHTPVDALACGTHKGLLGPLGLGFVHVSEALLDQLEPSYLGPSAALSLDISSDDWMITYPDRQDARRLETGNINYPGVAGLARSLALIDEAGPANIEAWVTGLNLDFDARLRAAGVDVVTAQGASRSTLTTIEVSNANALNEPLRCANVIASVVEGDFLRFSFGAYNTPADVESIADILIHALH